MHDDAIEQAWADHRRRVFDVAYRLLGSVAEADDVVQDAYARLMDADLDAIDDVRGWLITVAAHRALDRLRSHDVARRAYVGPWLPEPIVTGDEGPDDRVTLDESVRMALLVVLERLTPAERTALVLHDVFALSFAEIGAIVGRSEAACRQLASRARRRVLASRAAPGEPVDPRRHDELVRRFAAAIEGGDLDALVATLDPDVVGDFDSGGVVPGALTVELEGATDVAVQLIGSLSRSGVVLEIQLVNGATGVVVRIGDRVLAVIALDVGRLGIDRVHGVGNPAKLQHLQPRGSGS